MWLVEITVFMVLCPLDTADSQVSEMIEALSVSVFYRSHLT